MKWYSPFNPFAYWRKYKYIRQRLQNKRRQDEERKALEQYERDRPALLAEQEAAFARFGFEYQKAHMRVKQILDTHKELSHIYAEVDRNMFSEHWALFAALNAKEIHRILELGTFNGESARFLSILFPKAEILTVDLPDDDPIFIKSYGREDGEYREKFLEHRKKMLDMPNIRFIQRNSFFLPALQLGVFDCIWVDACHEYPDVAWDLCNAWHSCNPGGWVFCDDIYLSNTPEEDGTNATRDALLALDNYGICDVSFILKRFSPLFSANPHVRKHIGVMRKGS